MEDKKEKVIEVAPKPKAEVRKVAAKEKESNSGSEQQKKPVAAKPKKPANTNDAKPAADTPPKIAEKKEKSETSAPALKNAKKEPKKKKPEPSATNTIKKYFEGMKKVLETVIDEMDGSQNEVVNAFIGLEKRVDNLEAQVKPYQETISKLEAENASLKEKVKVSDLLIEKNSLLMKETAVLKTENQRLAKIADLHNDISSKLENASKMNKELTAKVAELKAEKEEETSKLMQQIERIVEEKSKLVEENLRFLGGNLDDLPLEELRSLELEIRSIHQNIQRTKDKREAEETLCVVCLEKPKVMAFSGCGHRCVCEACSGALKECPMCRAAGLPIKIFF